MGVTPLSITGSLILNGSIAITANVTAGGTLFPGTYAIATWSGTLSGTPTLVWSPPSGSPVPMATASVVGNEITLTVPPPPAAVTNLVQSTPSGSEIDLSWTLPTANAPTSLIVQQSTNGGATWTNVATLGATATSYAATGLNSSTSYSYQVVSSGSTGTSDSAASPSVIPGTPIPSSPAGLTGSYDYITTANLSWSGAAGATSYSIDRENLATGSWTTAIGTSASTSFPDSSGLSGTYAYRVSAVNAAGTSSPSAVFPAPRYATIDLGPACSPSFIANNGMILANSAERWVQGTWQNLTVPNAQSTAAWSMNNNGAVVGQATFAIPDITDFSDSQGYDADVRGVVWTQNCPNYQLMGLRPV
jgi:hypothetical protein